MMNAMLITGWFDEIKYFDKFNDAMLAWVEMGCPRCTLVYYSECHGWWIQDLTIPPIEFVR